MSRSSPARSSLFSSPGRSYLANGTEEEKRHGELSHRQALEAAYAEHTRVREDALRVYEIHKLKEERERVLEAKRLEEERLKAEARLAEEERKLQALRAKSIPKPEPLPEPKVEPAPPTSHRDAPHDRSDQPKEAPQLSNKPSASSAQGQTQSLTNGRPEPSTQVPTASKAPSAIHDTGSNIKSGLTTQPVAQPASTPQTKQAQVPAAKAAAPKDRYLEIHQHLKKLRRTLQEQAKVPGNPLKGKLGELRREIRVSIGQLTGTKGANAVPSNKIQNALRSALNGTVPSPPIDVSTFVTEPREPMEQATHNEPTMPSLFIYLINILSKGIINQFINECGANPKAADPVGVFAAQIFSNTDFHWRGRSLIDILMAKFRVVCPVVFGHRGNDRTERGRALLGWRKEGPGWITEQSHNDRMTGLGAGFASIALRDFSKSTKTNPYPPSHYWTALAKIINTPNNETSNTQYVVLRAMIEGHEQRFINFYGNAAIAALRMALLDFPTKAPANASAVGSLQSLVEVLRHEGGLILT